MSSGQELVIADVTKETMGEIMTNISKLLGEMQKIYRENETLKERTRPLEYKVEELEMYTREKNVVLYGLPQMKDESALDLAVEIGKAIVVPIRVSDMDVAHRLKVRNPNSKLPSPFIICFVDRWKRDKLKTQVTAKRLTAAAFGGKIGTKIFGNDHLSPRNQTLLTEARKLSENYFIWSSNGRILSKKKNVEGFI